MNELSTANILSIHVPILKVYFLGGATRFEGSRSRQSQIGLCKGVSSPNWHPDTCQFGNPTTAMMSYSLLLLSNSGWRWYPPLWRLSVAPQGWELWSRAQFHQCGLWSGKPLGSSTGTAMYQPRYSNLTNPSTRARHKKVQTGAASQRERRWLAVAAEIELQSSGLFLFSWLLRLLV